MARTRRPAGDLIEAVLENMRSNLEELRYSTVVPSRYAVFLSPAEHARLEGLIPRLQAETIRALNEELARMNRRGKVKAVLGRWFGSTPPLEIADAHWQVEYLPDLDGDLNDEQDIIVQSELALPQAPELGGGERTRRVTTMSGSQEMRREETFTTGPGVASAALARLSYTDEKGAHTFDILADSTTIGRGGSVYPVDVRVSTTDEVSREHARIRRDPGTGGFFVIDLSIHGTTVDGRAVPKGFDEVNGGKRPNGAEVPLPATARIGLAGKVFLEFQRVQ